MAASFFKVASRTLMPVKVWAMTSCSSRLIFLRSSSCADRIWRDNRPQLFLQAIRLFQAIASNGARFSLSALLHRFALGDFEAQFQVGGRQFHRALAQRLDEFFQVGGSLPCACDESLDRGNRRGKENPRLLDERGAFARQAARQNLRDQHLLVEFGQVQRLQPGGQGLLPSPRADSRLACGPASSAFATLL